MTGREEDRLVEHLYDELSTEEESAFSRLLEEDRAALAEVESFESTLSTLRAALPAEEPPPHLDAMIFAYARQAAEKNQLEAGGIPGAIHRWLTKPWFGAALAAGVVAIAAFVIMPNQLSEPSFDSAKVVEEAPRAQGFAEAPVPAAPVVAATPPAEVAEEIAEQPIVSDGREADPADKATADRLAQKMDNWEQTRANRAAPTARPRREADTAARGLGSAGGESQSQRVVARFDTPNEEPMVEGKAGKRDADDDGEKAKKRAPAKLEVAMSDEVGGASEKKGYARSAEPMRDGAEAEPNARAGGGAPAGPPAVLAPPKAPAPTEPAPEAPAKPVDRKVEERSVADREDAVGGEAEREGRAASRVAKAKEQLAKDAAPKNEAAAPSPARLLLAESRQKAQNGDRPSADQLAQRAVKLAQGTVELPIITLEAAEILLSIGNYALAERYAQEAERGLQLAARPRAQNVAKRAKAMRTQSDAPAARPTSDAASESVR